MNVAEVQAKRDAKAKPHLVQYAPVWIVEETMVPEEESILFNVVFAHSLYGWVNRRYKFDGFNQVLYFKGQNSMTEDEALELHDQEPYLSTLVTDIPNAYGG